ncbi:MAG TPA: MFS transporter, partial [Cellvibrio sp.]|nr:MFS transporter [Cellvibrio sp.]
FLIYSENFIIAPLIAEISASLNMSLQLSANLVSAYTLSVGFGALLYGPISDSVGRYKSICISLAGFAIFTFLCGSAWDAKSMYVFRILCGISAGILISNTFAYVGDYYMGKNSPQSIPVAMGKVMSGMFAAIVIGVPLGILVGHLSSWRTAFTCLSILCVFLLIFIVVGVEYVQSKKMHAVRYFASLASYFKFLGNAQLVKITALFFSFQFVVTAFATFSPLWIINHGYDLLTLTVIYGITGFISVFVSMKSGYWVKKLGITKTFLISNVLAMLALVLIVSTAFNIYVVTALMAVYLSCISLRMGPLQALSVSSVDAMERGRFSSFNSFAMQMGSSLGVALFSIMFANQQQAAGSDFSLGVYCLVGVTALSTLIAIFIKPAVPKAA